MIFDAIVGVLVGIVGALAGLLPLAEPMDTTGLATFVGFVRGMDDALPISETIAVGSMCLMVSMVVWTWHFWVMLYKLLPFT